MTALPLLWTLQPVVRAQSSETPVLHTGLHELRYDKVGLCPGSGFDSILSFTTVWSPKVRFRNWLSLYQVPIDPLSLLRQHKSLLTSLFMLRGLKRTGVGF
jgi:hypothetical protein